MQSGSDTRSGPALHGVEDRTEVDSDVLAALSRIVAAGVGLTARALAQTEAADDLTLAQWRTLVVIGQGMRVGEVAVRIGASGSSASRLVRRLERRGLATTGRDEADRRATIVRPTRRGVNVRATVVRRRDRLLSQALAWQKAPVPNDLVQGLDEIARRVEAFAEGPARGDR